MHIGYIYNEYIKINPMHALITVGPTNLEWCNFEMVHFVAVVMTCYWNMTPYGSTSVSAPPILKNGTTEAGTLFQD